MKKKEKAYAKINVSLKTLRKRDDGFHDLDMLMVNINLFDTLYFKPSKEIKVSAVNDTEYLKITVEDKSSKNAYTIAKTVSNYFTKEVSSILYSHPFMPIIPS